MIPEDSQVPEPTPDLDDQSSTGEFPDLPALEEIPISEPGDLLEVEASALDRSSIKPDQEPNSFPPATSARAEQAENMPQEADVITRIVALQQQEQALQQEIKKLQQTRDQLLQNQASELQAAFASLMQDNLQELEQRKQTLQVSIEQLERRQERIRKEMRSTFAGASQDVAIRVQSFKEYLVGSLQDLVATAEQLELVKTPVVQSTAAVSQPAEKTEKAAKKTITPQFSEQNFKDEAKLIRKLIDKYRTQPDYYGPPWQLRRTFEPVHADRVTNWFFTQGGRGTLRTMGSRLQNILVTSAIISILDNLYGDQLRALILVNTPERLGEWRRGLQDCLGITRADFGPDGGVQIFDASEALVLKADRLMKDDDLPLVIIDETEEQVDLGLLQFPLWLAFAPDPQAPPTATQW